MSKASSEKRYVKVDKALFKEYQPFEYVLNKKNVAAAVAECLKNNDFAGILEVVQIYLRAVKRAKKHEAELADTSHPENQSWETTEESDMAPKIARNGSRSNNSKKVL